jgi:two-component sensor histidine kinase
LISVLVALGALAWLTQRRRAGQQLLEARVRERTVALEGALAERNLMLREVYHRVKNNLQIVDSLVSFQAARMTDAESRSGMDDLRHRVHALGLVHQQLMNSTNLATFDIRPFLEELCANLATSAGADEHCIGIAVEAESLPATLDFAIPVGLLVTELVTNAFKHGYPDGQTGLVTISFRPSSSGRMVLTVADDGRTEEHRSIMASDSVGSRITWALVEQLEGDIQVIQDQGTKITVTVPCPEAS